jgi:glucosamine--fructose-6-phosphate aminotransferase (isomerizing)
MTTAPTSRPIPSAPTDLGGSPVRDTLAAHMDAMRQPRLDTDCTGRITVVADGAGAGTDERRAVLADLGHEFVTTDDAELAAHLVERALSVDPDFVAAVRVAMLQLAGARPFVVLDAESGRLVVAEPAAWSGGVVRELTV